MKTTHLLCLVLVAACGGGGSGSPDAATPDADVIDAAPPDAATKFIPVAGDRLSQMGLYSDFASRTLAPGTIEFEPSYKLWSDGATKKRYLQLPAGTTIDTSDMDHWQFPIGTRFFKEFTVGGKVVETRLIARTGPGRMDYVMGGFQWLDDGSDAIYTPDGAMNVRGTPHDIPPSTQCWACHEGDPGRILGFSAIQLFRADNPPNLTTLAADGLLSNPPATGDDYTVPGDATTQAALGYLHANCGHCHNPNGVAYSRTDQVLRLDVADRTPEATTIYRTAVNQMLIFYLGHGYTYRIYGGDPSMSAIYFRMTQRGNPDQMPPLATEIEDPTGEAAVSSWISTLTPPP